MEVVCAIPAGADALVKQQVDRMNDAMSQWSVLLPDEAVGLGARWQIMRPITAGTFLRVSQTKTFTLKEFSARTFSVTVDVAQKADPQSVSTIDGLPARTSVHLDSMSGTGSGSMTIGVASFTPQQSDLNTKVATVIRNKNFR
jgi:hypothetical protein